MKQRVEEHDFDGSGYRLTQVYDLPSLSAHDYWASVTDVPCPCDSCSGTIRWAEAGSVPGYRICDGCGRHFLAGGDAAAPKLYSVADSATDPIPHTEARPH